MRETAEAAQNFDGRPGTGTAGMQCRLDDITTKVAPCAHGILIFDQPGWHRAKALKTPLNLSIPLSPHSPELNPQEDIWQFLRQNALPSRVFKSYDDIVNHWCCAWNAPLDPPCKIMSIARRDWATINRFLGKPVPKQRTLNSDAKCNARPH